MGKYWESKGLYQDEYDRLWERLVPHEGDAETAAGQLLIAIAGIYNDVHCNGGQNLHRPHRRQHIDDILKHKAALSRHLKDPKDLDRMLMWANEIATSCEEMEELDLSEEEYDEKMAVVDLCCEKAEGPLELITSAAILVAKELNVR